MIQMTWPDDGVLDDVWVKVSVGSYIYFNTSEYNSNRYQVLLYYCTVCYIVSLTRTSQFQLDGTEAPTT